MVNAREGNPPPCEEPNLAVLSGDQEKACIVEWTGQDDPQHPQNLSPTHKWFITAIYGLMAMVVTFASSVFSTANGVTAKEFKVPTHVMSLATALTVLGLAMGPLVFGPMSELFGRKIPLLAGFIIFALFNIPVALANNLQTIMICRLLVGIGGSSGLAIVGGALTDIFPLIDRGVGVSVFAAATFIGSFAGPIVGGFVVDSIGWRWTSWLTLIPALVLWLIYLLFVPESYGPVILERRAKVLRCQTCNWALHAKSEEVLVDFKVICRTYLIRPLVMLVVEPILLLVTVYMSIIYGILYLFLEAYPISFRDERNWNLGIAGLPFTSLLIGVVLSTVIIIVYLKTRYSRLLAQDGSVAPEEALILMFLGAVLLPVGLFWFAWTSNPEISWVPQVVSGVLIGMGLFLIFLQGLNYIIDVYTTNANSAVAANVFLRSWVGAGFTMFAAGMYSKLGVPWATSLLGFLCVALVPVPIVFYCFGASIRRRSKFSK
ncbi:major facilitator superfamily domain-containing protein [Aspergillus pseudocaelatus]|uniref:Major facilitator superfamily domain-containing protein n=1 Tax=Aspergillus pseudocaelatus TaxID=1825620 RepID=A0ABQ6WUB6_9EURO|nr:major facilitator superfamily domain-containing protein [Aspergillus pseudocaelatus]